MLCALPSMRYRGNSRPFQRGKFAIHRPTPSPPRQRQVPLPALFLTPLSIKMPTFLLLNRAKAPQSLNRVTKKAAINSYPLSACEHPSLSRVLQGSVCNQWLIIDDKRCRHSIGPNYFLLHFCVCMFDDRFCWRRSEATLFAFKPWGRLTTKPTNRNRLFPETDFLEFGKRWIRRMKSPKMNQILLRSYLSFALFAGGKGSEEMWVSLVK